MGQADELSALQRELDDHRELLRRQAQQLDQQAATIDELRSRLGRIEADSSPAADHDGSAGSTGSAGPGRHHELITDRRHLLRHAGVAAAGAVAGASVLAQTSPAFAAAGTFDGNPAVNATANPTTGVGVQGTATGAGGKGVVGQSLATTGAGVGVQATSSSASGIGLNALCSALSGASIAVVANTNSTGGIGVSATQQARAGNTIGVKAVTASPTGTAIQAEGGARGVAASASALGTALELGQSRAAMIFAAPQPPPLTRPDPQEHGVGEIVYDTNGDLWLCMGSGVPGDFTRLGGGSTVGALDLLATPKRVYDSRPGEQPLNSTKGPISGGATGTTRVVDMTNNGSGVPATARAALVTLTIVNTSANGGFLALFRNGAATPASSSINWFAANQVIATTTVTALDIAARAAVFCPPNSSTNYFVDVIGFYQ